MQFSLFATAVLLLFFTPHTFAASEPCLDVLEVHKQPFAIMTAPYDSYVLSVINDGYAPAESWHIRERNWLLTNAALKRVLGFGITTA